MKHLSNLITSIIVAVLSSAIAVFSVQNVYLPDGRLVSLKFLPFLPALELPVGVILGMSVGLGLISGAMFPWFLSQGPKKQVRFSQKQNPRQEGSGNALGDWSEERLENW